MSTILFMQIKNNIINYKQPVNENFIIIAYQFISSAGVIVVDFFCIRFLSLL